MFANLFKPKWRHSSPEVRAEAAFKLRSDRPSHRSILRRLALDDSSALVRQAAISRLDEPDELLKALSAETDPELQSDIYRHLASQLNLYPGKDSLNWIEQQDSSLKCALIANGLNAELSSALLESITGEQQLAVLAVNAPSSQQRQQCANRIHNTALLEQVQIEVRNRDKSVYRQIKNRLDTLQKQQKEQQQLQQQAQKLIDALQHLNQSQDKQFLEARVRHLRTEWSCIADTLQDESLATQFGQLLEQAESEVKAQNELQASEAARAEQERQQQEQFAAAQKVLRDTLDECLQCQATEQWFAYQPILSAARSRVEELAAMLNREASTDRDVAYSVKLEQALDRLLESNTTLAHLLENTAALTDDQGKELNTLLRHINWPDDKHQPDVLIKANLQLQQIQQQHKAARQAEQQEKRELENEMTDLLNALDGEIEAGQLQQAEKIHQSLKQRFDALEANVLPEQLANRIRGLEARMAELRDWQGFALSDKRERLCERMEALIGVDLPPRTLAEQIKSLQKEWKTIDSQAAFHSQKLWQRFHHAAEQAYIPCDHYFAEQRNLRQHNLAQREEICSQLDGYLQQIDWDNADFKALEKISHTAKREWKQFSPVDRAPGKKLQARFNQLITDLDEHLKAWHQQCAELKSELVAQAQTLSEEADISVAVAEAKRLQQEWKEIGPAFRSEERTLWHSFKENCDAIFARLNDEASEDNNTEYHHYTVAPTLPLMSTSSLLSTEELGIFERSIELLDKIEDGLVSDETRLLPPLLAAVSSRIEQLPAPWNGHLQTRANRLAELLDSPDDLDPCIQKAGARLRELCIRLEILLGVETPDDDLAIRMEYQMDRFNEAMTEYAHDASCEEIESLQLSWQCVPFNRLHAELQARFRALLEQTVTIPA